MQREEWYQYILNIDHVRQALTMVKNVVSNCEIIIIDPQLQFPSGRKRRRICQQHAAEISKRRPFSESLLYTIMRT